MLNKEKIKQIMFENEGELFAAEDFEFVSKKDAELILKELSEENIITKETTGIFSKRILNNQKDNGIPPREMSIARKLAEINRWNIILSGESCLNLTNVSNQNPMFPTFASTGPNKTYKGDFGKVVFKHSNNDWVFQENEKVSLILEALVNKGDYIREKDLLGFAYFCKKNNLNILNLNIPEKFKNIANNIMYKIKEVKRERVY